MFCLHGVWYSYYVEYSSVELIYTLHVLKIFNNGVFIDWMSELEI